MRGPLIGIGIAGVLVGAYAIHPVGAKALFRLAFFAFVATFTVVWAAHFLIRQRALDDWPITEGRIESCRKEGIPDNGRQAYACAYLFSVDEARQGGELCVHARENCLDEIRESLVGQPVTVRYNRADCTQSVVEETHINGWKVS
jgi:Protein of unknown function (DUF3592)